MERNKSAGKYNEFLHRIVGTIPKRSKEEMRK